MLYLFFIILLALSLQIQVLPLLGLNLDPMLLVVLYYGFLYGWKIGGGVGLLAGLIQDIFSGGVLGISSATLFICGVLSGYTRNVLLLRYLIIRVMLVFLFSILCMFMYIGIGQIFSQMQFFEIFKSKWFTISLGNAIVSVIFFWLVDRYG